MQTDDHIKIHEDTLKILEELGERISKLESSQTYGNEARARLDKGLKDRIDKVERSMDRRIEARRIEARKNA